MKRNLQKQNYRKLTDEESAEYNTLVEMGYEDLYWKDKMAGMAIRFFGVLGVCTYVCLTPKVSLLTIVGIAITTHVVRQMTKLHVVWEEIET